MKKTLYWISALLFAAIILCVSYGYFVEPNRLVVNRTELRIKGWNPAFAGLRIAMISDIHGGSNNVTEEKIREIVARTNEERPDIVVLLGDYVSQQFFDRKKLKMPIGTIAENLSGLTAKYGVFAVLGNHDVWHDQLKIENEFSRLGYIVLENEAVVIRKEGESLRLFGLKDHTKIGNWAEFSREAKADLERVEKVGDVIVIEHSPDVLPLVTGDLSISPDIKLFLAGHTHGGQVRFPLIGSPIVPSSYGQKYARGHLVDNGVDMFVTTGVGSSILPFRFSVPPEIAVITVYPAE